jgi:hypothetical protein
MRAIIKELGNGFPEVGNYVPGSDGELYQIMSMGRIQTGRAPGCSNWVDATVELADWDDCDEEEEGPGMVVVECK